MIVAMSESSRLRSSELALLASSSTLLGGVLAATSDCAQPLAIATGAALFAALGAVIALLAMLVFAFASWAAARASARISAHAVVALLASLAAIAPAHALFSGHGVRRTALGLYGPWLVALAVAAGTWVLSLRVVPALRGGRRLVALACALVLLAVIPVLVFFGRVLYPGLYRGIHTALVVAVAAAWVLAALPLAQRVLPRALAAGLLVLTWAGAAATALVFGGQNHERKCLEGSSELAYLASAVRDRFDLDGDGASPLFGGDDCADWDPAIGPAAADVPGDGRDADCDGRDGAPAVSAAEARRYRTDPAMAARIREHARGRPTVVLLIDALRDDRVGSVEFPALATLARESLRFSRAFANSSSTKTSLAAMLTGRLHPPLTTPNLAQRLRAGGKRAALIWLRHLMDEVGENYPVLRGFDPLLGVETTHQASAWGSGVSERTSEEISQRVLDLLDSDSPPDLIWAHYFDVHQWDQLFPGPREQAAARYDSAVAAVDRNLAPLLARRDRINIVLLADHGESLSALDRLWHTTYVGADVVRVPWLIRVPGIEPASVAVPIGLTELTPTLLDLLGVTPSGELAGRSALGLVGVAEPGRGPPIFALETREWSILADGLRLRYAPNSRSFWLHDVVADPHERIDISQGHPDRVALLRGELLSAVRAIEREHGEIRYGYDE